ncbi:MAG: ECF-type sigma factor [Anaeromyxobacter sp.]
MSAGPRDQSPAPPRAVQLHALVGQIYDELRAFSRDRSGWAPATLANTAGANSAIASVLAHAARRKGAPPRWKSQEHLLAYCLLTLKYLWATEWRRRARRRDLVARAVHRLERLGEDAVAGHPADEAQALEQLIQQVRDEPAIASRHRIARVAEYRLILGATIRDTARVLRVGETQVKEDLAFFRAWVRIGAGEDLVWYERALQALEADPAVSEGALIAEVARREARGEGPALIAAALRLGVLDVQAYAVFARAWVAQRARLPEPEPEEAPEAPPAAEEELDAREALDALDAADPESLIAAARRLRRRSPGRREEP